MAFEWLFGTQSSAMQAKTFEGFLNMVRSYPLAFYGTLLVGGSFILYRTFRRPKQYGNDRLIQQQTRLLVEMAKKMVEFETKFAEFKIKLDQQSEAIGQIVQWQKVAFLGLGDCLHDIKKSVDGIKGEPPKLKPPTGAYKKP